MKFFQYLARYMVAAVVLSPLPALADDHDADLEEHVRVQWSYKGARGPQNWGALSEDFRTCSEGKQQSPINIFKPQQTGLSPLEISYEPTPEIFFHTGPSVQVHYDVPSGFTVNGANYDLEQFHFHTPAENLVNFRQYPAEAHFVHKSEKGKTAILSVFFTLGKKNKQLQKMIKRMPRKVGEVRLRENARLNAGNLLPKKRDYYRFVGSLTMPPCTEGVQWFVLKNPVSISKKQIKQMKKIWGANARPVQEGNNRLIIKSD